jgi:hypothetical protein
MTIIRGNGIWDGLFRTDCEGEPQLHSINQMKMKPKRVQNLDSPCVLEYIQLVPGRIVPSIRTSGIVSLERRE